MYDVLINGWSLITLLDLYEVSLKFYSSELEDPKNTRSFKHIPIEDLRQIPLSVDFIQYVLASYSNNFSSEHDGNLGQSFGGSRTRSDYPQTATNATVLARASTRGYHTSCLMHLEGQDYMFVWGGLQQRSVITCLEAMHIDTRKWYRLATSGKEPSARFGHSCLPVTVDDKTPVDQFVFTGGSDGNDLIRNGRELLDVSYFRKLGQSVVVFYDLLTSFLIDPRIDYFKSVQPR